MASCMCLLYSSVTHELTSVIAKLAKPTTDSSTDSPREVVGPLPQTLVRIPTEHAPALQAQAEAAEAAAEEDQSRIG
jgi:DASH complex subunit DAD2